MGLLAGILGSITGSWAAQPPKNCRLQALAYFTLPVKVELCKTGIYL